MAHTDHQTKKAHIQTDQEMLLRFHQGDPEADRQDKDHVHDQIENAHVQEVVPVIVTTDIIHVHVHVVHEGEQDTEIDVHHTMVMKNVEDHQRVMVVVIILIKDIKKVIIVIIQDHRCLQDAAMLATEKIRRLVDA